MWGIGRRSAIELPLARARPLTLVLECRPFPRDLLRQDVYVPSQAITVVVNGLTAGSIQLTEGFASYQIDIPQDAVVPSRNVVEFRYAYSPGESGFLVEPVRDGTSRAVAWTRVAIEEALSLDAPRVSVEEEALELPFNTGIEYFMHLPEQSVLSLERLKEQGDSARGSYLEVGFTEDGSGHTSVFRVPPHSWRRPASITIPLSAQGQLVRVSFIARPGVDGITPGGLSLFGPALIGPGLQAPSRVETSSARGHRAHDGSPVDQTRPNVLVYVIDTLRADRLGAYGYPLNTSPHLDSLARDGLLFTTTSIAQSSWTRTSVASIFTGLYPRSHGVNGRTDELSPDALTMAALLSASGYETADLVTNGNVSATFGFDLGFESYVHLREQRTEEVHVLSDALNEQAFAWLDSRDVARPFFLYLHATDPHAPYTPRNPFRARYVDTQGVPRSHNPSATPQSRSGGRDLRQPG